MSIKRTLVKSVAIAALVCCPVVGFAADPQTKSEPIGRVTAAFGDAHADTAGGARPIDVQSLINNDERITTDGGGLTVLLASRVVLKIDSNSAVSVFEGPAQTNIRLERGTVQVFIGKRGPADRAVCVSDPNGSVQSSEGVFLSHYDPASHESYVACEHAQGTVHAVPTPTEAQPDVTPMLMAANKSGDSAGRGDGSSEKLSAEQQVILRNGKVVANGTLDRVEYNERMHSLDRLEQSQAAQGAETFRLRSRALDTESAISQLSAAGWIDRRNLPGGSPAVSSANTGKAKKPAGKTIETNNSNSGTGGTQTTLSTTVKPQQPAAAPVAEPTPAVAVTSPPANPAPAAAAPMQTVAPAPAATPAPPTIDLAVTPPVQAPQVTPSPAAGSLIPDAVPAPSAAAPVADLGITTLDTNPVKQMNGKGGEVTADLAATTVVPPKVDLGLSSPITAAPVVDGTTTIKIDLDLNGPKDSAAGKAAADFSAVKDAAIAKAALDLVNTKAAAAAVKPPVSAAEMVTPAITPAVTPPTESMTTVVSPAVAPPIVSAPPAVAPPAAVALPAVSAPVAVTPPAAVAPPVVTPPVAVAPPLVAPPVAVAPPVVAPPVAIAPPVVALPAVAPPAAAPVVPSVDLPKVDLDLGGAKPAGADIPAASTPVPAAPVPAPKIDIPAVKDVTSTITATVTKDSAVTVIPTPADVGVGTGSSSITDLPTDVTQTTTVKTKIDKVETDPLPKK